MTKSKLKAMHYRISSSVVLVANGIGLKCRFNALLARVSTSVFKVGINNN
jgi:hypothetical protein